MNKILPVRYKMSWIGEILDNFEKRGYLTPTEQILLSKGPVAGGASVFDADVILVPLTANFGIANDEPAGHVAVTVEPGTAWIIAVMTGPLWTGTTPLLDVNVQFSNDGGTTYRQSLIFTQITEAMIETDLQRVFYGVAVAGRAAATFSTLLMRARTTAGGTTPNLGTTGVFAMAADIPQNFATGPLGYDPRRYYERV